MTIGNPGGLPIFTDGQGRVVLGDDLARDTGQSTANGSLTVTQGTGFKRKLGQITVHYSSAVTQNVTITLISGVGSSWNTVLDTIVLNAGADGVSTKVIGMLLGPDDAIQVSAPAGGVGVTSQVAIYSEIIGATQRAVSASS